MAIKKKKTIYYLFFLVMCQGVDFKGQGLVSLILLNCGKYMTVKGL